MQEHLGSIGCAEEGIDLGKLDRAAGLGLEGLTRAWLGVVSVLGVCFVLVVPFALASADHCAAHRLAEVKRDPGHAHDAQRDGKDHGQCAVHHHSAQSTMAPRAGHLSELARVSAYQ